MLAFSALVAGSFSLGSRIANEIAPDALTAVRFWIAAGVLLGVALAKGQLRRPLFAAPWRYFVLGALFASYFVLMFEGLKTAPPVSAAAVFTLTPILAAGFGWLILRQRLTPRMALALTIGGLGAVWVIFRGDVAALLQFHVGRGELVYFVGCMAHALYIPMVRLLNRGEATLHFTFSILLAGAVMLTAWSWPDLVATDWAALRPMVWITLAYIAVVATSLTFVLLQIASMRLPAAKVMAYTYLTPSWVIGWELALGGAVPPLMAGLGVAVTIVALILLLRDDAPAAVPAPT